MSLVYIYRGCTSGGVMYLVFTHKPVKVTVGDPGLCCCVYVMSFECSLIPLCVDSVYNTGPTLGDDFRSIFVSGVLIYFTTTAY